MRANASFPAKSLASASERWSGTFTVTMPVNCTGTSSCFMVEVAFVFSGKIISPKAGAVPISDTAAKTIERTVARRENNPKLVTEEANACRRTRAARGPKWRLCVVHYGHRVPAPIVGVVTVNRSSDQLDQKPFCR